MSQFRATPGVVFDRIVSQALAEGFVNSDKIRYYQRNGLPLPDRMKPGALLERLSPEDREALSRLTSETVKRHALRPEYLW